MYEDPENKASKTNIVAWVAIAIGAALVVPVSISQLSLNEIKEQNSAIEVQRQEIQKQRDLIYELNNKVHELEKQIIRQPK
jgi:FtsZ-binding cell division protein ZapB